MYYRLKQTDFNGEYKIYDPIEINPCSNTSSWNIVTAAAQNGIMRLTFQSGINDEVKLKVYDMLGNSILEQNLTLFQGYQSEEFSVPNLEQGVYLISCKSNSHAHSMKLISRK
jgi:hypothetical protein